VLKGQPVPKPAIQPGNPNPGRTSGISVVVIVLLVGLVAAAIGVLVFLRSRRRPAPRPMDPNDPHPGETTQQLNDRSIGRHRHYAEQLAPFLAQLQPLITARGY